LNFLSVGWYSRLAGYKGLGQEYRRPLAAFLNVFLRTHWASLEALAGDEFGAVAVVPSSKPDVGFDSQWLVRVTRAALRAAGLGKDPLLRDQLAHIKGVARDRNSYVPDLFVAGPEAPREGETVLLVEDLWVSGSTAASAAGALLREGARRVVIVPIALEFRDNDFCPDEYREAAARTYDRDEIPRDDTLI
jgi:predicted amidophosphoribosyltransferase